MKLILSLVAMLCLFFGTHAQEYTPLPTGNHATTAAILPPLKPGDYLPNLPPGKALNYNGRPLNLAGFKGKLLILDFWSTTCGACIEAMPRLDSLAAAFGNRVMILPVTTETAAHVAAFQKSNRYLKGERFKTVVEDQVLSRLFPHRLLPHDVWINANGIILGFTAVEAITAEAIQRALDGKGLQAPEKKDVLDYDRLKPLLVHNNGGDDTAYQYRSVITRHLPGVQSAVSIRYDTLTDRTIIKATNVRIRQLYTILFKGIRALPDSQVNTGPDQNIYCYELDFPGRVRGPARKKMQQDLDAYFHVRPEWTGSAFRLVPNRDEDTNEEPLSL